MRAVLLLPRSRNLACGENSHALRLANASLRESLVDLRAANANRIRCAFGARSRVRFARSATNNKARSFLDWALLLARFDKKDAYMNYFFIGKLESIKSQASLYSRKNSAFPSSLKSFITRMV